MRNLDNNNSDGTSRSPFQPRIAFNVVDRLLKRAILFKEAQGIFGAVTGGRLGVVSKFIGEGDNKTLCGSSPRAGDTVRFDCPQSFSGCSADYNCPSGVTFSNCGNMKNTFSCNADTVGENFDCNQSLFDCASYGCGQASSGSTFECNEIDFLCGAAFQCMQDFDCTAGHVFLCSSSNDCIDLFGCSSTGDVKCPTPSDYSRPDSDGIDRNPGDFVCGMRGGTADTFNCVGNFDCNSEDEFDCVQSTGFTCIGPFDCKNKSQFECDDISSFGCETSFGCHDEDGFLCDSRINYECPQGCQFDCPATVPGYTNPPPPPS